MTKFTISWHEDNLRNSRRTLNDKRRNLERLRLEVERHEKEGDFYAEQITEAKKRGLTEFDSDRLLVKRKNVSA